MNSATKEYLKDAIMNKHPKETILTDTIGLLDVYGGDVYAYFMEKSNVNLLKYIGDTLPAGIFSINGSNNRSKGRLGNNLYLGGSRINDIEIPNNIQKVQPLAFYNCPATGSIKFLSGSKITILSSMVFGGASFSSILLPDNLSKIGVGEFRKYNINNLVNGYVQLGIPKTVTQISKEQLKPIENLVRISTPSRSNADEKLQVPYSEKDFFQDIVSFV